MVLYQAPYRTVLESFGKKRNENTKKNAQGAALMAGASTIWKLVKSNLLREYDVDLLGPTFDFLRFSTTSFELRAVDRSMFCHLSPRPAPPAPQSHHIISAVTAL